MKDKLIGDRAIYDEPIKPKDRFLNTEETAELLGLRVGTLENMRREGKSIPYFKFGRHIKYKRSDVIDYIQGQKVEVQDD